MMFVSCLLSGLALTGLVSARPTTTISDVASPVVEKRATVTTGLAVYWGQPGISVTGLTAVCTDGSYTQVNLAFITTMFGRKGYPEFNLDRLGPSAAQQTQAPGLIDGTSLKEAIGKCQSRGIKVVASIGGATGYNNFTAAKYAQKAATDYFNLFLGGSNTTTAPIRPFGDVVLDGVDLDPENKLPAYYTDFVSALRTKMKADTKHTYVITASPQCSRNYPAGQPVGDKSLPDSLLKLVDHVFIQFYNNPSCNHGSTGLLSGADSIKTWSTAVTPAKVWVGAPASSKAAGSGYISNSSIAAEVTSVKKLGLANFGGYMLWDAEEAYTNYNYQKALRTALNKAV